MKIKRMRLVLPPRMRNGAQQDARTIAKAAATALHGHQGKAGPVKISVAGHGRSARMVANDVATLAAQQLNKSDGSR